MEPSTLAVLNFIIQLVVSGLVGVTLAYIFIAVALALCVSIAGKRESGFEIIAIWLPMMIYPLMPIIWMGFTYLSWSLIF